MDSEGGSEKLNRLQEVQEQCLKEVGDKLVQWRKYDADYKALVEQLLSLPDELTRPCMVPFGSKAFIPGRLVHTNEIMVLLGDNWFVERSAKQAAEIARRRLKQCEDMIEKLNAEREQYVQRSEFMREMKGEDGGRADGDGEGEGVVEIGETISEAEHEEWMRQHEERVRAERRSGKEPQPEVTRGSEDVFDRFFNVPTTTPSESSVSSDGDDDVSESQDNVSESRGNVSQSHDNVHESQSNISESRDNVSVSWDNVSESQGKAVRWSDGSDGQQCCEVPRITFAHTDVAAATGTSAAVDSTTLHPGNIGSGISAGRKPPVSILKNKRDPALTERAECTEVRKKGEGKVRIASQQEEDVIASQSDADDQPVTVAAPAPVICDVVETVTPPVSGGVQQAEQQEQAASRPVSKFKAMRLNKLDFRVICEGQHNKLEQMRISVTFERKFEGLLYSKGYYKSDKCRSLAHHNVVTLVLPLFGCGMTVRHDHGDHQDLYDDVVWYNNTVIVMNEYQWGIIEAWDKAYNVFCSQGNQLKHRHEQHLKQETVQKVEGRISVPMLRSSDVHGVNTYEEQHVSVVDRLPECWMKIVTGKDITQETATQLVLGTIATIVWGLHDITGAYDVQVYNCLAYDGYNAGGVTLVNEAGCPANRKIIGFVNSVEVELNNNGKKIYLPNLYAHFKVFKFPDQSNVYFECHCRVCHGHCQQPVCDSGPVPDAFAQPGSGRRYRREVPHLPGNESATLNVTEDVTASAMPPVYNAVQVLLPREYHQETPAAPGAPSPGDTSGGDVRRHKPASSGDNLCLSKSAWILLAMLVSCLLLCAAITVSILCCRLRRHHNTGDRGKVGGGATPGDTRGKRVNRHSSLLVRYLRS